MRIDVITLFPQAFDFLQTAGVSGRAHALGLWSMHCCNPRDFVRDVHRTVDDRPYGGGPGMVMMAEPLIQAVAHVKSSRHAGDTAPVVLLSPAGQRFSQHHAQKLAESSGAIFVCGRYEGIDQRFIDHAVDEQWSLGDFVLSGGEPAAVAMMDAAVRLIPGVLGDAHSCEQDSFQDTLSGLLDAPHYTRPETLAGQRVPAALLSGHHAKIAVWRREQSLRITATQRPDLIDQARAQGLLTSADERFLQSLPR